MKMNKIIYQENNESIALGIFANNDGTFTAMTYSQSKTFKTQKGAVKWYERKTGKKLA